MRYFSKLIEGLDDLAAARVCKRTRLTQKIECKILQPPCFQSFAASEYIATSSSIQTRAHPEFFAIRADTSTYARKTLQALDRMLRLVIAHSSR